MKKGSKNFLITFSMICVIFVPAIATYSFATKSSTKEIKLKETKEINKNVAMINDLNKRDLSEIEKQINKIQISYYGIDKDFHKIDYNNIFKKCVIMGDSQVEGLAVYNFLNSNSIIAKKGSNLVNSKSNCQILKSIKPSKVFMLYGLNDMIIYKDNVDEFIKNHKSLVIEVKKSLPKSEIFINSILPVQEQVKDKNPIYKNINKYNKELKKMCSELNITFIDTSNLFLNNDELHEKDGIHLKPLFYPAWLEQLKKQANL